MKGMIESVRNAGTQILKSSQLMLRIYVTPSGLDPPPKGSANILALTIRI